MNLAHEINSLWTPFRQNSKLFTEVFPYRSNYAELLEGCERAAWLARSLSVWSMTCASLGHPGGTLSEADLLAVIYNYVLRYDPGEPGWTGRDVFYLSKCHACPGLYSTLALFGYFSPDQLKYYGSWGAMLESHPDHKKTPGIEISGGSLGQIPGVAVGRALGIARNSPDNNNRMLYTLLGDGECNEGSVWEAFMAAGHYRLDNIVFMIDYNKVQAKGFVKDDMTLEPLADKLRAFNLDVWEVRNGHDISELISTFNALRVNRRGRPHAVILNTEKGHKIGVCNYNPNWHTSAPRNAAQAADWLMEMWERDGQRLGIPRRFVENLAEAIEIVPPLHSNPDAALDNQA